jgi:hypothetical protein
MLPGLVYDPQQTRSLGRPVSLHDNTQTHCPRMKLNTWQILGLLLLLGYAVLKVYQFTTAPSANPSTPASPALTSPADPTTK